MPHNTCIPNKTILIADNDHAHCFALKQALQKISNDIITVKNRREVLGVYESNPTGWFCIVINHNTQMDSEEITCTLRQYQSKNNLLKVNIVGIFDPDISHIEKRAQKCGMTHYLLRPVKKEQLINKVLPQTSDETLSIN